MPHSRQLSILAAQVYLLSRRPNKQTVSEIQDLGTRRAQMPCLYGINIPAKQQELKNVLGKPLPTISL
jgi:hypothetical protein